MEVNVYLPFHVQMDAVEITISRHMKCNIREATGIELLSNNMNRENGFSLCRTWKALIHIIKE
jgi:hypothetical protein